MDESVIRELEQAARQQGLKLSAAIRIGAKLRPQCFKATFTRGGSCAFAAAYEALYGHPGREFVPSVIGVLEQRWKLPNRIVSEVIERNDALCQTREQIADWLESIGY